jgi:hypothetical protein
LSADRRVFLPFFLIINCSSLLEMQLTIAITGIQVRPCNINTCYLAPVYTAAAASRFPNKVDDAYFRLLPSGQTTVTPEEAAMLAAIFVEEGELPARPAGASTCRS